MGSLSPIVQFASTVATCDDSGLVQPHNCIVEIVFDLKGNKITEQQAKLYTYMIATHIYVFIFKGHEVFRKYENDTP